MEATFFVSFIITWTNKVMKEEGKMVEPQKKSGHWGAIRREAIGDDSVRNDNWFENQQTNGSNHVNRKKWQNSQQTSNKRQSMEFFFYFYKLGSSESDTLLPWNKLPNRRNNRARFIMQRTFSSGRCRKGNLSCGCPVVRLTSSTEFEYIGYTGRLVFLSSLRHSAMS